MKQFENLNEPVLLNWFAERLQLSRADIFEAVFSKWFQKLNFRKLNFLRNKAVLIMLQKM